MIHKLMDAFRLRGNERTVLQHVVQLHGGPASEIARLSGIPRNTTRGILDKLVGIGLLAKGSRGISQVYSLETLENITRSIEQSKQAVVQELDERCEAVKSLGEVLWSKPSKTKPRITLHEGYSGLERVYEDTLTAKDGLRSWASFDVNQETLPRYFRNYYRRRAERKIPMRSIHPDSALAREHMKQNRKVLRTGVLVPKAKFDWNPEIQVYNNKVSIVSWRERVAVLIESEEIAQAVGAMFELSWIGAKAVAKK